MVHFRHGFVRTHFLHARRPGYVDRLAPTRSPGTVRYHGHGSQSQSGLPLLHRGSPRRRTPLPSRDTL
eukprot:5433981-Prymnesium_polylepis.1